MKDLVIACALALGVWVLPGAAAHGDTFTAGGLTFSDELGGFRLISVSGTGTSADPIVIVEEVTDVGPAILVIRGRQM